MQMTAIAESYYRTRLAFFQWRVSLSWTKRIGLALGMACLTGLLAQARIPLPWTPVPVTLQTAGVMLSGVLLGGSLGAVSQVLYIALGVLGVPWFNGWGSGMSFLTGATGGYLIGFVLSAACIGRLSDRHTKARGFLPMFALMNGINLALIYIPGLVQLAVWQRFTAGAVPGFWRLLAMGVLPFIPGDLVKFAGAAAAAKALTPKEDFHGGR